MRRVVNAIAAAMLLAFPLVRAHGAGPQQSQPSFHTSDRCLACHNQLITPTGQDVSIGFDWRASIMANSSRDPYWQASVRREDIDHPESKAKIEDSCADCHMPVSRFEAKEHGRLGGVFEFLPFAADPKASANAEDGVTCSVCHQISKSNFGTRQSFNGGFAIDAPVSKVNRPEYGPFDVQPGQTHIMESSTGGFRPTESAHVRQSALCATCHTLYTKTLDSQGKVVGELPEQMPYLEWQHSDYKDNVSCQSCHMPQVNEEAPIAAVLGQLRTGVRQHTFIGGNFFMLRLLNLYRDDLIVSALPPELTAQAQRTTDFLQSQAARVTLRHVDVNGSVLAADVFVENLSGHKLPTAFPSRRAWLHFVVKDGRGQTVFESGALNADGSIRGNDNDADPLRFEPHYTEITSPDEVQIYEDILRDPAGRVTTGLTAASGYAKDNRLLPSGFDKQTASKDIAVRGEAADDANFTGEGDLIRYSVSLAQAQGPFRVQAELWYQPVGFRWAHNLASYNSPEPQRFVRY
nr:hypothetical protein [Terriglobales bacterium]